MTTSLVASMTVEDILWGDARFATSRPLASRPGCDRSHVAGQGNQKVAEFGILCAGPRRSDCKYLVRREIQHKMVVGARDWSKTRVVYSAFGSRLGASSGRQKDWRFFIEQIIHLRGCRRGRCCSISSTNLEGGTSSAASSCCNLQRPAIGAWGSYNFRILTKGD